MRAKYDWQGLKHEFISGGWLNVSTFFTDKGITNNSYARNRSSGWPQAGRMYLETVLKRATEKIIDDEAEVRSRQARFARQLQAKGVSLLDSLQVNNADHARKLVVDGLRQEREALGLEDNNTAGTSLTQTNVQPPINWFDKMTNDMNYEDILEFLAAIKKERTRRAELAKATAT